MINYDKPLNFGSTAPYVFRQTHSFSLRKAYPFTTNQDKFHNVSHVSGTRSHSNSFSSYCTSSGCWARIILGPHPKKGQAKWWAMTSKGLQETPGIYIYVCISIYLSIYLIIYLCLCIRMYVCSLSTGSQQMDINELYVDQKMATSKKCRGTGVFLQPRWRHASLLARSNKRWNSKPSGRPQNSMHPT